MGKGTKVGEHGQIWNPRGQERRKEGWRMLRARYGAGLFWCTVALGLYKGLVRWLLFPEKAKAQKGHTASS